MLKVIRDFGVDVAGQHFVHGATIDPAFMPAVPAEVPEENRAHYEDGLKRAVAADITAARTKGTIVPYKMFR